MDPELFGARLKLARVGRGWTQTELAERSMLSAANTICLYEQGRVLPVLDTAAMLAKALGVSLDWLTGIDNYFVDKFKLEGIDDVGIKGL